MLVRSPHTAWATRYASGTTAGARFPSAHLAQHFFTERHSVFGVVRVLAVALVSLVQFLLFVVPAPGVALNTSRMQEALTNAEVELLLNRGGGGVVDWTAVAGSVLQLLVVTLLVGLGAAGVWWGANWPPEGRAATARRPRCFCCKEPRRAPPPPSASLWPSTNGEGEEAQVPQGSSGSRLSPRASDKLSEPMLSGKKATGTALSSSSRSNNNSNSRNKQTHGGEGGGGGGDGPWLSWWLAMAGFGRFRRGRMLNGLALAGDLCVWWVFAGYLVAHALSVAHYSASGAAAVVAAPDALLARGILFGLVPVATAIATLIATSSVGCGRTCRRKLGWRKRLKRRFPHRHCTAAFGTDADDADADGYRGNISEYVVSPSNSAQSGSFTSRTHVLLPLGRRLPYAVPPCEQRGVEESPVSVTLPTWDGFDDEEQEGGLHQRW